MKKDGDRISHLGLNEINELKPNESYSVCCDQADNGVLTLNAIKKTVGSKTVNVTVKEDEAGDKPTGTYYFLSVIPQSGKEELIELYKETVWSCVDVFVTKKKKLEERPWEPVRMTPGLSFPYRSGTPSFGQPVPVGPVGPVGEPGPNDPVDRSPYLQVGGRTQRQMTQRTSEDMFDINQYLPQGVNDDWFEPAPEPITVRNRHLINISRPIGTNTIGTSLRNAPSPWPQETDESNEYAPFDPRTDNGEDSDVMTDEAGEPSDLFDVVDILPQEVNGDWFDMGPTINTRTTVHGSDDAPIRESYMKRTPIREREMAADMLIEDSLASTVSTGRKISVHSVTTNIEYNYDTPAVPCVIGLSISDKIIFNENVTDDELIEMGKEYIIDMIEAEGKKLLAEITQIYMEEHCVVCLNSEHNKPTNIVFYQCGHCRCHSECVKELTKCPLCRRHISAQIVV